jgi:Nuclease-related domain
MVMRVVELSNHPGRMLSEVRGRRRSAEQLERSRFEKALARHEASLRRARRARDQARARRQWLTWLRLALAVRRERRHAPRPPTPVDGRPGGRDSDREEILAAGVAGEELVEASLHRRLDDEWTLIRGYRNRRGEIDHLLLGPRGVVAIEVKHRNATVHCDGDDWRFDKYDNYGNLVEQGRITDARGRSPSVQLNEPADALEELLRARGHRVPVRRVVLLTHSRSRIGRIHRATVQVATSADFVLDLVNGTAPSLTAGQLGQMRQLIERDHRSRGGARKS